MGGDRGLFTAKSGQIRVRGPSLPLGMTTVSSVCFSSSTFLPLCPRLSLFLACVLRNSLRLCRPQRQNPTGTSTCGQVDVRACQKQRPSFQRTRLDVTTEPFRAVDHGISRHKAVAKYFAAPLRPRHNSHVYGIHSHTHARTEVAWPVTKSTLFCCSFLSG